MKRRSPDGSNPRAQGRERDRTRRHLVLHVEGAAPPHLAVHEVAGPRIALPFGRIRENRVGVAQEHERRPAGSFDSRNEVRPLGHSRVELRLDAVPGEVVAEQLRRLRLFPGGLTVSAEQRLQKRRDLPRGSLARCLGERGQLVAHFPELGVRRLRHEAAEKLDRGPLCPDDAVSDDPRDDLVVTHAPELRLLVQLDERLRELVQVLVVPPWT